jgi:ubiquinone/menaquinone biosynthesis C-methylase UbiE
MIELIKKDDINYLKLDGKVRKQQPWLNGLFVSLYDWSMKRSVFPKKFNASYPEHLRILKNAFQDIHHNTVLEVATGSGNVVNFLPPDNNYHGIDISEGLLRLASKKLKRYGFPNAELYLTDACHLPFSNSIFEVAVCNLALNFIENIETFIAELKRVLKPMGMFICSVPVPEKINKGIKIRGTLYSQKELEEKFENHNFSFQKLPGENGGLLYFIASLNKKDSHKSSYLK